MADDRERMLEQLRKLDAARRLANCADGHLPVSGSFDTWTWSYQEVADRAALVRADYNVQHCPNCGDTANIAVQVETHPSDGEYAPSTFNAADLGWARPAVGRQALCECCEVSWVIKKVVTPGKLRIPRGVPTVIMAELMVRGVELDAAELLSFTRYLRSVGAIKGLWVNPTAFQRALRILAAKRIHAVPMPPD